MVNDIFESVEAIQVLYFLSDHNPHVTIETLSKELGIDGNVMAKTIKSLLELEIIQPSEDKKEYSLTPYGKNMVNILHELMQPS